MPVRRQDASPRLLTLTSFNPQSPDTYASVGIVVLLYLIATGLCSWWNNSQRQGQTLFYSITFAHPTVHIPDGLPSDPGIPHSAAALFHSSSISLPLRHVRRIACTINIHTVSQSIEGEKAGCIPRQASSCQVRKSKVILPNSATKHPGTNHQGNIRHPSDPRLYQASKPRPRTALISYSPGLRGHVERACAMHLG